MKLIPAPLLYCSPGTTEDRVKVSTDGMTQPWPQDLSDKRVWFESGEGARGAGGGQVTASGWHVSSGHGPSPSPRSQRSDHLTGGNKHETVAKTKTRHVPPPRPHTVGFRAPITQLGKSGAPPGDTATHDSTAPGMLSVFPIL